MAEVTLELDDALLAAAAHILGTHSAVDTVRAALEAVTRVGGSRPRTPAYDPRPGHDLPPLGDPPTPGAAEDSRPHRPAPPRDPLTTTRGFGATCLARDVTRVDDLEFLRARAWRLRWQEACTKCVRFSCNVPSRPWWVR
jgi:hypothetical protein